MNYTLKQLKYFIAAAELNSVTKASRKVHVSQPSVSAALTQLEDSLNARLFVRHQARGLTLTPVGRELLGPAKRLLAQAESLAQAAGELTDGLSGTLSIASLLTLAPILLPPTFRAMQDDYPALKVNCHELNIGELVSGLREGNFEMAVTYDLDLGDDIAFTSVRKYPTYVILPENHSLSNRRKISLRMLRNEPMILLDLPHTRDYFLSVLKQCDVDPEIAYRTQSPTMVMGMVAAGFGYSLLNARPMTHETLGGGSYCAVEITDKIPSLNMGIAGLRNHSFSRAGHAFVQVFSEFHAG